MRKLFTIKFFFGVSFLISILSLFFYYRYTCSPEYSIGKIVETYKDHNLNEFNKYVDTKNLITGVLNKIPNDETNPFIIIYQNLTRPQIEEAWLKVINNWVENGIVQSDSITNKEIYDSIRTNQCVYRGIKDTKMDGKVATISLELYQKRYDTTLVLKIKMRDMGDYWQLFDISNIIDYANVGKNLESNYINTLNNRVKKDFLKNIKIIKPVIFTKKTYDWYTHTYSIDFKNIGGYNIESFNCNFVMYDKNDFIREKDFNQKYYNKNITIEDYVKSASDKSDHNNLRYFNIYNVSLNIDLSYRYIDTDYLSYKKINQDDMDIYIQKCEINFGSTQLPKVNKNDLIWNDESQYWFAFMMPVY